MPDREAFLRAIADNPEDDTTRLVYADWLDERGDPLGEFIRVQVELEPLREDDGPQADELRRRERELLRNHEDDWLGLMAAAGTRFDPRFRRGLVESAFAHPNALLGFSGVLAAACPLLRELTVYAAPSSGPLLARLPGLCHLRGLELVGRLGPEDAAALAESPFFRGLEWVSVWVTGREVDEEVCGTLAWRLGRTGEFRLVQLLSGHAAGRGAGRLATHADRLARLVDGHRGRGTARVVRPADRLFPLAADVGDDVYAGTLPGGEQSLVCPGRTCHVLRFGRDGGLLGVDSYPAPDDLHLDPDHWSGLDTADAVRWVGDRTGFRPGRVRVREFEVEDLPAWGGLGVRLFGRRHVEFLERIGDLPHSSEPEESAEYEEHVEEILDWLDSGHFVVRTPDEAWSDGRGTIRLPDPE